MSAATIGSALAEKRLELGLEKGRAADMIGMSRTTYSSYEQDAQRPSADVFPALARFLDISIEELLTLYGATCVAALRTSLMHVMTNTPDGSGETRDVGASPSPTEVTDRGESGTPDERATTSPKVFESTVADVTPEASDVEASEESQWPEEVREEQAVPSEREADAEESANDESTIYEHSHFDMTTPRSPSGEKNNGNKKKKKKKKKKKN